MSRILDSHRPTTPNVILSSVGFPVGPLTSVIVDSNFDPADPPANLDGVPMLFGLWYTSIANNAHTSWISPYPLMILSQYHAGPATGHAGELSYLNAINAANPAQLQLCYVPVAVEGEGAPIGFGVGYDVMRAAEIASDLWLRNASNVVQTITWQGNPYRLYDYRKPAWKTAFLNSCLAVMNQYAWNGLFLDNCTALWSEHTTIDGAGLSAALLVALTELRALYPTKLIVSNCHERWSPCNGKMVEDRPNDEVTEFGVPGWYAARLDMGVRGYADQGAWDATIVADMATVNSRGAWFCSHIGGSAFAWPTVYQTYLDTYGDPPPPPPPPPTSSNIASLSSSTLVQGGTLVLSGTAFGTGGGSVLLWEDFETKSVGTLTGTPSIGTWALSGNGPGSVTTAKSYSGTKSHYAEFPPGGQFKNFECNMGNLAPEKMLHDFNFWFQVDPPGGGQEKIIFTLGSSGAGPTNYAPNIFVHPWDYSIGPENPNNAVDGGINPPYPQATWTSVRVRAKQSTPGVADGSVEIWRGGVKVVNHIGIVTRNTSIYWQYVPFFNGMTNQPGASRTYLDNCYLNDSWAVVELCDAPSYDNVTVRNILPATAWGNTSITCKINTGQFTAGSTRYLYVTNSEGVTNQSGFPVLIGSAGSPPVWGGVTQFFGRRFPYNDLMDPNGNAFYSNTWYNQHWEAGMTHKSYFYDVNNYDTTGPQFTQGYIYIDSLAIYNPRYHGSDGGQGILTANYAWVMRSTDSYTGVANYTTTQIANAVNIDYGTPPDQYAGDIFNPAYRAWFVTQVQAAMGAGIVKGIWLDDVNPNYQGGLCVWHEGANLSWSGGTATATFGAGTSLPVVGQSIYVTGASVAGYNGTYTVVTSSGTTSTYALGSDPGGTATASIQRDVSTSPVYSSYRKTQLGNGTFTVQQYYDQMVVFVGEIKAAIAPYNGKLLINTQFGNMPYSNAAARTCMTQLMAHADLWYFEFGVADWGVGGERGDWGWKTLWDYVQIIHTAGKGFVLCKSKWNRFDLAKSGSNLVTTNHAESNAGRVGSDSGNQPSLAQQSQYCLYNLCTYLLWADGNDFLADQTTCGSAWYWSGLGVASNGVPYYDLTVGAPLSAMVLDNGATGKHTRAFTNATVTVYTQSYTVNTALQMTGTVVFN